MAKFASYQKTLSFVIEFAIDHRVTGAYNRKLAYAGTGYNGSRGFNLKKPETTQYRTERAGRPDAARTASTRLDANKYLSGLTLKKGVLSEKGITLDSREYYRFNEKCEYMGLEF